MNVNSKMKTMLAIGSIAVVSLGILTGKLIATKVLGSSGNSSVAAPGVKVSKDEAGALDSTVKYDNEVGKLVEGGTGNEGTHHLERDGGPSQNVYLTSSVIDLQSFVGKKVEVWGQTLASKKAGWLMDVAKVKIVE